MIRLLGIFALAACLSGCIVAPPSGYGYGYDPGPVYQSGPGYYAAPSVDVGIGFSDHYGGGYGGHGGHGR